MIILSHSILLYYLISLMKSEIPKLRRAVLTGKILVAVEPELEKSLKELKHNHDVDISEWLRRIIRSELPKLIQDLSV